MPQWCPLTSEGPRGLSLSTWFSRDTAQGAHKEKGPQHGSPLPVPRCGDRCGVSIEEKLLVGEGLVRQLSEYFYFLNVSTLEARNTAKRL